MEDGGHSLFEFVVKVHKLIQFGKLEISEWHRIAKIIFKQMIEAIEYIHSKNIAHFDISLENFLINDIDVLLVSTPKGEKIRFDIDGKTGKGVQVKLCDFGLAELFPCNQLKTRKKPNSMWKTNKYCGKSCYKSPEIAVRKKYFDAKANDIFCLGVCLFMMIIGNPPWKVPTKSDASFCYIWSGQLLFVLSSWNKLSFVTKHIIDLFGSFFKSEDERIQITELKNSKWLNR